MVIKINGIDNSQSVQNTILEAFIRMALIIALALNLVVHRLNVNLHVICPVNIAQKTAMLAK